MHDPDISAPASLLADPTRAAMVLALMDGRSHSAKHLALNAGVTPQTASAHLKKLVEQNLVVCHSEGRCKYFKIADSEVASAIEGLSQLASRSRPDQPLTKKAQELRFARCCYDHLAGRLGVAITQACEMRGLATSSGGEFSLTGHGRPFLEDLGIDVSALARLRRPLLRLCIDWTERQPHMAGSLGAALLRTYKEKRWLIALEGSRKLRITREGEMMFRRLFALDEALFRTDAQAKSGSDPDFL